MDIETTLIYKVTGIALGPVEFSLGPLAIYDEMASDVLLNFLRRFVPDMEIGPTLSLLLAEMLLAELPPNRDGMADDRKILLDTLRKSLQQFVFKPSRHRANI